jgi:hypothetical protein
VRERRCDDCGVTLGELCVDHTGDLLCRGCYLRRPGPMLPAVERLFAGPAADLSEAEAA